MSKLIPLTSSCEGGILNRSFALSSVYSYSLLAYYMLNKFDV